PPSHTHTKRNPKHCAVHTSHTDTTHSFKVQETLEMHTFCRLFSRIPPASGSERIQLRIDQVLLKMLDSFQLLAHKMPCCASCLSCDTMSARLHQGAHVVALGVTSRAE